MNLIHKLHWFFAKYICLPQKLQQILQERICFSWIIASYFAICLRVQPGSNKHGRYNNLSSMASKPITIRWIKIGSQPDWKIMYSIELQTIFYEYQNFQFCQPGLRPIGADKTGFNRIIFHFDNRGKLSIIRCDKYILKCF